MKYLRDDSDNPYMNVAGTLGGHWHFEYTVPENNTLDLAYIHFMMVTPVYQIGQFGPLPKLANGIVIHVHDADDNKIYDMTNGEPIKALEDLKMICGEWMPNVIQTSTGPLPGMMTLFQHKICPAGQYGEHGFMTLTSQQKIHGCVRDDLTSIPDIRMMIVGQFRNPNG